VLKLTEDAAQAIRDLLEADGVDPSGGLRVTAEQGEDEEPGLHLDTAEGPAEGDVTVEEHGVRVFLDPSAAAVLDDKVLDAEAHGDHSHFGIEDQTT
jgi:iron-sulfur cluster assembly protein